MSKKKSFSGSTMTLKDFHGGSIPSDLPLPSAPGVIVRPSERSSFDRQISAPSWGSSSINRSDHRSRPGSSGPTRTFDEKASFLSVPNIGRNFDEDERKPFDGGVPRRPVSEDALRPLPSARLDPKPLPSRQISTASVVQSPPAAVKPAAGPNAWGSRIEAPEPVPSAAAAAWSASSVVSKFAQASAVEKVSSGRWQSKPTTPIYHHPPDVEVIRYAETERETDICFSANHMDSRGEFDTLQGKHSTANQMDYRSEFDAPRGKYNGGNQMEITSECDAPRGKYNGGNQMDSRSEFDAPRGKYSGGNQMESRSEFDAPRGTYHSINLTDSRSDINAPRAAKYSERGGPPMYLEVKERSSAFYSDGIRPASTEGKLGSGSQSQVVAEVSERPKLKLLPRTKPMDPAETQVVDHKQGYQSPHADLGHIEVVNESVVNLNPPKPGSAGGDGVNRAVERPRLNLKPRSQPLEQSEDIKERERKTLFGGARPRELVLKERGVDDVVINNLEYNQLGNRAKHDLPKPDTKPDSPLPTTRNSERHENLLPSDQRSGREFDRRDHRPETEKMDMQRSSWRNENRRNSKEIEKPQEWRPEPESWRKPVEPPIPPTSEAPAPRFGRAASALELAQAFSRTMSDAKSTDKFVSQRSLPARNQIPFSRLTDAREFYSGPTTRQINGY